MKPKSCKHRVCRRPACASTADRCKAARAQTYYDTSSPCQRRRFDKLGAPPKGKLFSKTASFIAAFKSMRVMQTQHFYNSLILKA